MRQSLIAAVILATATTCAFAQTGTASGSTGRVNSGTATTAADTHNGKGNTDPQSVKGKSGSTAKSRASTSTNASGTSGTRGTTEGGTGADGGDKSSSAGTAGQGTSGSANQGGGSAASGTGR